MAASTAAANTTFFMALAFKKFFLLVLCFRQKQGRKTVPEHDIFVGFVFIVLIYSLLVWRCGGREACLGLGRFVERCGGIPRFAGRKSAESLAIACKIACRRRLFRLQDLAAFAVGDYLSSLSPRQSLLRPFGMKKAPSRLTVTTSSSSGSGRSISRSPRGQHVGGHFRFRQRRLDFVGQFLETEAQGGRLPNRRPFSAFRPYSLRWSPE